MNIKRLFEKTSTGLKEFVAKVDFANVIGLTEELTKYVKRNSNAYVAEINPDINFDGDVPVIDFIYGDGSSKSVILDLASEEFPGLMSTTDKNKIDNYVGTRLNVPNITYVNPELQEEYTSIGYEGIKYTNGVCTFNVSNGDINIKSDNIKINETEISYIRGSNSTTLNQTGLIVDDTSTESFDNSTHRITITSNTIKYKYFIDNSMTDGESKSGDYTYTFPDKSGTIELVDEEKNNKLKHIALVDGLHNKYCNFASAFKSFEELAEYVNNNKGKITEAYTIFNDETNIQCVSLGTDGALVFAQFGLDGIAINYGNLRNDGNATLDRTLGFNDEAAIFPSNLQLITDNNELYSLNLDKCIELGILTKDNTTVQISNTNLIV
jgi:hypothetical protein